MTTRRNVIAVTAFALSVAACDILTVVGDIDGSTTGASSSSGSGGNYDNVHLIGFIPGFEVHDPKTAIGAFSCWMNSGAGGVQIVGDSASLRWADYTDRLQALGGSTTAHLREGPLTLNDSPTPLLWSIALTPKNVTLEDLVDGGPDGATLDYFTTEAKNLKNYGFSNVIWRIGFESDQNHWPWAVYYQAKDDGDVARRAALYAAAFRLAVKRIRDVDSHARFEYNTGLEQNPIYGSDGGMFDANVPAQAYPGDEFVDFIGTESSPNDYATYDYANGIKAPPEVIRDAAISSLEKMKAFARSRGKPFVVSRWSVTISADGHGSGDSAVVMKGLLEWLNDNCYYHLYFNSSDFAFNPTTVKVAAHGGDTTLAVYDASAFPAPSDHGVAFLRYSIDDGKTVRQLQYGALDKTKNAVSSIPSQGFGSIPEGGIPADAEIVEAISRLSQIAIGVEDDDIGEGDHGYRTNPDFTEAGAAFHEVLNPEAGPPCEL